MLTLVDKIDVRVRAEAVRFEGNTLYVAVSGGREIRVPLAQVAWLAWLANASPAQRARWSIEPGGFAIQWDDLDDGIEVDHLLGLPYLMH